MFERYASSPDHTLTIFVDDRELGCAAAVSCQAEQAGVGGSLGVGRIYRHPDAVGGCQSPAVADQTMAVEAVTGDPDCPVNRGTLCAKGYALPQILYGKDRLTKPLLRKGNKYEEIGWDQAIDIVAVATP